MFKSLTSLLNILFPIECVSCGKLGVFICDNCFYKIEVNKPNFFENECISQVHIASSYHQKTLQTLIHFFKYQFIRDLGDPLSKILIDYYSQIENKLENPILVPVPLHKIRQRERCFNQSEILGNFFANHFKYELNNSLLVRKINTKHQADLNKRDRLKNIKKAFFIKDINFVKNKNFIIIDDVYTTGSTVLEISKLLKQYGAKEIWVLVIAKN